MAALVTTRLPSWTVAGTNFRGFLRRDSQPAFPISILNRSTGALVAKISRPGSVREGFQEASSAFGARPASGKNNSNADSRRIPGGKGRFEVQRSTLNQTIRGVNCSIPRQPILLRKAGLV